MTRMFKKRIWEVQGKMKRIMGLPRFYKPNDDVNT